MSTQQKLILMVLRFNFDVEYTNVSTVYYRFLLKMMLTCTEDEDEFKIERFKVLYNAFRRYEMDYLYDINIEQINRLFS
jgi:hypothetical protein